uniref:Spectrin alpha, non-erythrocytic 1 n=1 Tax=Xiphophorus couchianus TaxID=32473 RepID=A0A3B5KUA7_9TELE
VFVSGIKLREANQQQQFNRNVEDIELWLYERRQDLEDSLQQFSRDVDEIEAWISEKLQTATDDEDYGDTLAAVQVTSCSCPGHFL